LDSSVALSVKNAEAKLKRGIKEEGQSGRVTPLTHEVTPVDDKSADYNTNGLQTSETDTLPENIHSVLANNVLPILTKLVQDADKVTSICAGIVYHLVMPIIRCKLAIFDEVPENVLRILQRITQIPSASKAWKGITSEAFNSPGFFQMSPDSGQRWNVLIQSLHTSDKSTFPELVARISTAVSGNLFTSKEAETVSKVTAIRRLSYTLFTGVKDSYMANLSIIQEKLVEILRSGLSSIVIGELYLCMRVIITRFSPHNLSGLWPVVITNMLSTLEFALQSPHSQDEEFLCLLLSICKFIDLAVTLQTPELQMYQWMFITDTADAIYPPEDWSPHSLLDRLAEVVRNIPSNEKTINVGTAEQVRSTPLERRPLLGGISSISRLADLETFFSHTSLDTYEGLYGSCGRVDRSAIEQSLITDIFSGR